MFKVCEEQFRACHVFCDAKSQTILNLCKNAEAVFYAKNHQIYFQDDHSTDFHLIVSGTVRAKEYSPDGKEVSYGDIGPGEIFGEFAALDQHPRSSAIIAIEDVQALRMNSDVLCSTVEMDGGVALKLLLSIVQKTRKQTDRVFEFSVLAVRQRIQQELLRLAKFDQDNCEDIANKNVATIEIPTHQELANRLGTHREAVTKELGYLTSKNLIQVNKHKLQIVDLKKLAEIAGWTH